MITDGYQVYHKPGNDEPNRFIVAGCWAHMKRKFTEIIKSAGKSKSSSYTIASKAEKRIPKSTTKTIYDTNILTKESATGKAITYALNQEKFLRVFLNDERLPMDNNEAERTG